MSTTITGIPRAKPVRTAKAKPLEPTMKRPDPKKKKGKDDPDDPDDPLNAWRKK
jgi:hypothetical protein